VRVSKEPRERRNEILDTAEKFFAVKGYEQTTIVDILNEIGIAKGTFYYYFKSKEEVMDAIIMRIVTADAEAAKAIADSSDMPAIQKLLAILFSQKPGPTDNKEALTEQFHQSGNAEMHQKTLVQTIKHLSPILTTVVEQGIDEGVMATPYPRETVDFLLAAGQVILDEGLFQWSAAETEDRMKAFILVVETSLGAEEGSFEQLMSVLM
jgi:AcrR family transcriptional regulator